MARARGRASDGAFWFGRKAGLRHFFCALPEALRNQRYDQGIERYAFRLGSSDQLRMKRPGNSLDEATAHSGKRPTLLRRRASSPSGRRGEGGVLVLGNRDTLLGHLDRRSIAPAVDNVCIRVPFGRCAVIAPDDLSFGLGRMFHGFSWPMFADIRVFRSNADAVTWLNDEP